MLKYLKSSLMSILLISFILFIHISFGDEYVNRPIGNNLKIFVPDNDIDSDISVDKILTINKALQIAFLNNPDLVNNSWNVAIFESQARQEGAFANPELELEFGEFEDLSTTIKLSQGFELGGKRRKRKASAMISADIAQNEYEALRINTYIEIKKAFVDICYVQENLYIMEIVQELTKEMSELVTKRGEIGKDSPLEVINAEIEYQNSKLDLAETNIDFISSKRRLATLMGQSNVLFEKAENILVEPKKIPELVQLSSFLNKNPKITKLENEIKQLEIQMKLEKANRIPDIGFSGGLTKVQSSEDLTYSVGMAMPLPIFDRNSGNIIASDYSFAKKNSERTFSHMLLEHQLIESYNSLELSFENIDLLSNELIPIAAEAFGIAQEGLETGRYSLIEVLEIQRNFFAVKIKYNESLQQYHHSKADIEGLIGITFEEVFAGDQK